MKTLTRCHAPPTLTAVALLLLSAPAIGQPDIPIDDPRHPPDQQQAPQGRFPMVYRGEGLVLTVDSIDRRAMTAQGSIALRGGPRQRMTLHFQRDPRGDQATVGEVQTRRGPRQIQIRDQSATVAEVRYEGRTIRVQLDPPTASGGDGSPMEFAGDGMKIVIQSLDRNAGVASGTMTVNQSAPMQFTLRFRQNRQGHQVGDGRVETQDGPQQFHTIDVDAVTSRVELGGRNYTVKLVENTTGPDSDPDADPGLTYAGDGMTVILQQIDDDTGAVAGTMQLGQSAPMQFSLNFRMDQQGREIGDGQLHTPQGVQQFQAQQIDARTTRVQLDGRTYTLVEKQPPSPRPNDDATPKTPKTPKTPWPNDDTTPSKPWPHDDTTPKTPWPNNDTTHDTGRNQAANDLPGTAVFTLHKLRDRGMGGMESHTLLAPKGWTVKGGAWWANTAYFRVAPSRDIYVTAPDGREVHLHPSIGARDFADLHWTRQRPAERSAENGLPVIHMPTSLEEWKHLVATKTIPTTRHGASRIVVTNAVVIPELTQVLRRSLQPLQQQHDQASRMAGGSRTTVDGRAMAFECTYVHEGRTWEELVVLSSSEAIMHSQVGRDIFWDINPVISFRAPQGQLAAAMPLLVTIGNTVRPTPQWHQSRVETKIKMAGLDAKSAAHAAGQAVERSRIMAEAGRFVGGTINAAYGAHSASQDATHARVVHSIRGTRDYVDARSNDVVTLPDSYSKVFSNGRGEYIVTNDVLFDPNTDPKFNDLQWSTMSAQR